MHCCTARVPLGAVVMHNGALLSPSLCVAPATRQGSPRFVLCCVVARGCLDYSTIRGSARMRMQRKERTTGSAALARILGIQSIKAREPDTASVHTNSPSSLLPFRINPR